VRHRRNIFLIAACLAALGSTAKADVLSSFSVNPGTINAGQQSTLDLTLSATQDQNLCNCFPPYLGFTGGSVTLFSGTGLSQSFTISFANPVQGSFLGPHLDFQFSFTYPTLMTQSRRPQADRQGFFSNCELRHMRSPQEALLWPSLARREKHASVLPHESHKEEANP
jgi:hypothetical protein